MQQNFLACRARAKKLVLERLAHFTPQYNVTFARVTIKDMVSRWGSCSRRGNLNFNYRLLFLPPELVDYVVVHEVCHLREMNHSRAFWALVGQTIPDYAARKHALRAHAQPRLSFSKLVSIIKTYGPK